MRSSYRSRGVGSMTGIAAKLGDAVALTEVGAVFVLPGIPAPWGGPDALRYTVEVVTPTGDRLYLRSHGLAFNAHPKPWIGQGLTGSFSIGTGLVDAHERLVFLAQSFEPDALAAFESVASDRAWAEPPLRAEVECYGRSCALLSGIIDR